MLTYLKRFVGSAIAVVEIVIAMIFEDGLRHYRVAFAERRGSVKDLPSGVGDDVRFAILCS